MWYRRSEEFTDDEIDFGDEDFPVEGCDFESLGLHEALDRMDRAADMKKEIRSYKELFGRE